jgi:hypothetical protein
MTEEKENAGPSTINKLTPSTADLEEIHQIPDLKK